MRKFYFLLFAAFTCLVSSAQTVIIDPAGVGGFESGTTFAANGWTVANTTNANKWFLGTVPGGASFTSRAAYISSDAAGATWTFTNSSISVSHVWRDVTVPAGERDLTLSFNWQALGESGAYDALMVSVAPTSYTPAGSTTSLGLDGLAAPAVTIAQYWNNNSYQSATLKIPASLLSNCSGAVTFRLIFTWKNDSFSGSNPPAAIDNISLVSQAGTRITSGGTYTIDNTLPNTGTNFITFTEAVNAANAACLTAPLVFNVTSGQTFTENVPFLTLSGTSANTVTFQKSGAGANPQIRPTGSTGTTDFGFGIWSGDYITVDGIDVVVATGSAVEYGYLLRNISSTDGATNNTLRNISIILNRANTSSYGILQTSGSTGGGVVPTAISGANINNRYYNISVQNAYTGIYLNGGTSTYPETGNEIGTIAGGNTVIGAAYTGTPTGDIGGGSSTTAGVNATNQSGIKIFNVTVRNIAATTTTRGIYVTSAQGNSEIYNNKVYGLRNTSSTSTSSVNAVEATLLTTGTHTMRIYNNFISDVTSAYTGTASATRQLKGILLGSGAAASSYAVDFNSVSIDGSGSPTISSTALEAGGSTTLLYIRNNILANFTGAQTGVAKHYTIRTTSATIFGASGSVSNYNDLYIANATNGFIGLANATDKASLADWRGTFNTDANSINVDPAFTNQNTDLHISPGSSSVDAKGTPVAGITTDIEADTRNATTPDIGADEYNVLVGVDVGATALVAPIATGCYSAAETVVVTIRNFASTTQDFSVNPVTVTVNVTGAVTYSSSITINTGTLAAGATLDVTLPATLNMITTGTYTFNASTSSTGDISPANNALTPATRTVTPTAALPQTVDFTGFTGTNLTAVFSNWTEATGVSVPAGNASAWTSESGWSPANTTAKINLYTNTRNEWIVGPKFVATATASLAFDVAITDFNLLAADPAGMQGTDDKVMVKISTDCGQSFTTLYTFDASNTASITNSLVPQTISLAAYAGQQVIIAFHATDGPTDDAPDYDFHIDNIAISDASSCLPPTGVTVSGTTGFGTNVNWTGTGSFILEYGPANFTPGTGATAGTGGTVINPATSPQAITGLTPSTAYDVYVRRDCSGAGNGFSANTTKVTFTTTVACAAPTSVVAGSITANSASITWTGTGSFILEYGPANFTPGTGATAGTGGTVINPATSPQAITGLTPSTAYDVYVRQDCSGAGNGFSANATKVTLTTRPNCTTNTFPANGATVVNGSSVTLTWAAASGATSYDVYLGSANPPTSTIATSVTGTSYTYLLPNAVNATYYWYVVPKNATGGATGCTSNITSFTTDASPAYCVPVYSTGCTSNDRIVNFQLKGEGSTEISNNTGTTCTSNAYNDYTSIAAPTLAIGKSYWGNARTGTTLNNITIWIDFNDNGTFETAERLMSNQAISSTGNGTNFNLFIPAGSTLGTHRMRVRNKYSNATTLTDPCTSITYGETEDYSVTIVATGTPYTVSTYSPTGSCNTEPGAITINAASNNASVDVPIVDASGSVVARINAAGQDLGSVTTSYYKHNGSVRSDAGGVKYLDRNVTITTGTAPSSAVALRLYFTEAERAAFGTAIGNPGVPTSTMLVTKTNQNTCPIAFGGTVTAQTTPSGFGNLGGDHYVDLSVSSFSTFYLYAGSTPLPARLLTFAGSRQGSSNLLKWTVAQESDVQAYQIERSENGSDWTTLGTVSSLGNTTAQRSYSFTDNNVVGLKHLYRLRQVEMTGAARLSNIVIISSGRATVLTVSGLFPNPAITKLSVLVDAPAKDNVTIQVMDAVGRMVKTQKVGVESGSNTLNVDVTGLTQGSYIIRVVSEAGAQTAIGKFVKE